jgi:hypothetical protein
MSDVLNMDYPIPFIVSVARSGTTLLRLMLDTHPDLAIPPETHFLPDLFKLAGGDDTLREEFYSIVVNSLFWEDFHISKLDFRNALEQIDHFSISSGIQCFYRLYAARFNKPRWGDKTPPYNLHMLAIQSYLPQAHFIHIIRDGRDVALSSRDLWFGPGKDIKSQARHWSSRIYEARRQAKMLKNYLEVHYEDLVNNPEDELKKICRFIALPYHPKMQGYYISAKNRLAELNDRNGDIKVSREQRMNIHKLTTRPPDRSRIGKWRTCMSIEERCEYELVAGDLLRELGYETFVE